VVTPDTTRDNIEWARQQKRESDLTLASNKINHHKYKH